MPQDLIRGMADLSSTPIGIAQAEHLGARIAHKGGIDSVMAGPLIRTRQLAAAILRHNPRAQMAGVTKGLLPWASGEFEGAPIDVVHGEMAHYIRNPHIPFPGVSPYSGIPGESLDQFWKGRLAPHVYKRYASLRPGEKALDATHYRDIRTVRAHILAGAKPDLSIDKDALIQKDHTEPGSLFKITLGPNPDFQHINLNEDTPLEPGYYMARHGATQWSKENTTGEGLDNLRQNPHGNHILRGLGLGLGRGIRGI